MARLQVEMDMSIFWEARNFSSRMAISFRPSPSCLQEEQKVPRLEKAIWSTLEGLPEGLSERVEGRGGGSI